MKTPEKLVSLLTWPKVTQIYRETWPLNWPELVACWLRNCTSSLGYWGLNTWSQPWVLRRNRMNSQGNLAGICQPLMFVNFGEHPDVWYLILTNTHF